MAAIDSSLYEKFLIESVDGSKTADISEGVVSFNYNEDLYSPMLTAKVLVINTGNTIKGEDGKMESLYNGFPLRGLSFVGGLEPGDIESRLLLGFIAFSSHFNLSHT